jgi:aminoglycoside phosphotransferase (APT) family kinase protein
VTPDGVTRFGVERTVDACLRARSERRQRRYRLARPADLRAPLERWLGEELGAPVRVGALERAPGGASKENFFFSLESGGERRALLLRLDPGESIVETHRLREFQVLRAVEGAAPVPRVLAVDPDGVRLERPSLVMERVSGRPQPELDRRPSGVGIRFEPELRATLADDFLAALVAIHSVDWRAHDLSAFDVPRAGTAEAAGWSLAWWERVHTEDAVEEQPVIALAAEWLRAHLPSADRIAIVHGDYRSGNFLYDDSGRIRAILDWELAHLGDPHEDLGWVVNELFTVRDSSGDKLACGLLEREEMLARYERAVDWKIDRERLRFYEIFNNYKLAVCAHTTALRIARGQATHLAASMALIHAFAHRYVAELARALGLGKEGS